MSKIDELLSTIHVMKKESSILVQKNIELLQEIDRLNLEHNELQDKINELELSATSLNTEKLNDENNFIKFYSDYKFKNNEIKKLKDILKKIDN